MITTIISALISITAQESTLPEDSIYGLESQWIDQNGRKLQLKDFSTKPVIVSMVFLGCKYTCPLTIQDMREMESSIIKNKVTDFRMVLISIDPERDTPQAMKKFMGDRKLSEARWTIISSDPDNVRELAALMGYSYKKDKAMEFAHSMLTWVFDEQGVLRFTRNARKESISETVDALLKLHKVPKANLK